MAKKKMAKRKHIPKNKRHLSVRKAGGKIEVLVGPKGTEKAKNHKSGK